MSVSGLSSKTEQRDGEFCELERVVVLRRQRRSRSPLLEPALALLRRGRGFLQDRCRLAEPPALDRGGARRPVVHYAAVQRLARPEAPRQGGVIRLDLHAAAPEQAVDLGLRAGGVGREEVHGDGREVLVAAGAARGAEGLQAERDVEVGAPAADGLACGKYHLVAGRPRRRKEDGEEQQDHAHHATRGAGEGSHCLRGIPSCVCVEDGR
uniref:Uncharacterized protein n=1 Tax=Triticum urartu TaxID=4572 RepID=A0A8R7Q381_TRIUA